MNYESMYPSAYLKAAEVEVPRLLTIRDVAIEDIGNKEMKPCMHFVESQQGIVLNRTNGNYLAEYFGPETDVWIGRQIELYSAPTTFQGKAIQGLRVRLPQQAQAPMQQQQQQQPYAQQPAPQQAPQAWPQQQVPQAQLQAWPQQQQQQQPQQQQQQAPQAQPQAWPQPQPAAGAPAQVWPPRGK